MPGWHDHTRELEQDGRLAVLGVVQEQHAERARLFMQWKGIDWPLAVDALNLLEVPYVPITVAVDDHGIVRAVQPTFAGPGGLEEFLQATFDPPDPPLPPPRRPDVSRLKVRAVRDGTADSWSAYARELFLWGGDKRLDDAIEGFRRAAAAEPDDGWTQFRLGVALRTRYDTGNGPPGDFQAAVAHWGRALTIDPNNYIWRRRIQQYGPRPAKPYPFYDWVRQARDEVRARGDEPLPLRVEPGVAELAKPVGVLEPPAAVAEPDPEGRVHRDRGRFVRVETTVVPAVVEAGGAARVHLVLRPDPGRRAHWNNEAGDLVVWVSPPDGWLAVPHRSSVPNPPRTVSLEPRRVEFELATPTDLPSGTVRVPAYALYYVCEGAKGACLYRRQDLALPIEILAAENENGGGSESPPPSGG